MVTKPNARSSDFHQRRHDATVQTLVAAAEAVMARQGYHSVTMRDIAAEAGCAPATLYIYFENKQDVVDAIGARHTRELLVQVRAAMAMEADGLAKLKATLRVMVSYTNGNRSAFRIVRAVGRARPVGLRDSVPADVRDEWQAFWAEELETIRQAQAAGALRADFTPELIQQFWGVALVSLLDELSYQDSPPDLAEQVRIIWGFIAGGICRG
jgi:AcrR family transcriptional regulator